MSTIDLSDFVALLARWSPTGCDHARAIKRRIPHSPPRSWLSRTAIDAATSPNALTDSRNRQRPPPHPIAATRAAAAKSP
jgi:hypothetical protein